MRYKLKMTVIAATLGFALAGWWSGEWGGLGDAYAQAQTLVKKASVSQGHVDSDFSGKESLLQAMLIVHGDNGKLIINAGKPKKIRYQVSYTKNSGEWNFLRNIFSNGKSAQGTGTDNTVKFDKVHGMLKIHTGSNWSYKAELWAPPSAQLNITNHNGTIRVVHHQGTVIISAGNGVIKVDSSEGPIKIREGNGKVMASGGVKGTDIQIHNGTVSVKNSGPKISIKINNGEILYSPGNIPHSLRCIEAHVTLGSIDMSPPWSACSQSTVDLEVNNGRIVVR